MAFSQNGQGYLLRDLNFYPIFGFRAIIVRYASKPIKTSKDSDDSLV